MLHPEEEEQIKIVCVKLETPVIKQWLENISLWFTSRASIRKNDLFRKLINSFKFGLQSLIPI
jgi:hypothetical protein